MAAPTPASLPQACRHPPSRPGPSLATPGVWEPLPLSPHWPHDPRPLGVIPCAPAPALRPWDCHGQPGTVLTTQGVSDPSQPPRLRPDEPGPASAIPSASVPASPPRACCGLYGCPDSGLSTPGLSALSPPSHPGPGLNTPGLLELSGLLRPWARHPGPVGAVAASQAPSSPYCLPWSWLRRPTPVSIVPATRPQRHHPGPVAPSQPPWPCPGHISTAAAAAASQPRDGRYHQVCPGPCFTTLSALSQRPAPSSPPQACRHHACRPGPGLVSHHGQPHPGLTTPVLQEPSRPHRSWPLQARPVCAVTATLPSVSPPRACEHCSRCPGDGLSTRTLL